MAGTLTARPPNLTYEIHMGSRSNLLSKKILVENLVTLSLLAPVEKLQKLHHRGSNRKYCEEFHCKILS